MTTYLTRIVLILVLFSAEAVLADEAGRAGSIRAEFLNSLIPENFKLLAYPNPAIQPLLPIYLKFISESDDASWIFTSPLQLRVRELNSPEKYLGTRMLYPSYEEDVYSIGRKSEIIIPFELRDYFVNYTGRQTSFYVEITYTVSKANQPRNKKDEVRMKVSGTFTIDKTQKIE